MPTPASIISDFTSWSLSFYPQPIKNFRRRSVSGTAIDTPFANLIGFICYTSYTACFRFSPVIKAQYAARHPDNPRSTVSEWDFAFALHALLIIAVMLSQFWWFPVEEAETRYKIRWTWFTGLCAAGVACIPVVIGLVLASLAGIDVGGHWQWIDVVYALSTLKLALTLVKYTPQVILNYRRKSTEGWSIWQILLDFTGGIASISQLVVDSAGHSSGISGNLAKLLLGIYSMFFDVIFMYQHYIAYGYFKKSVQDNDEDDPVPNPDERTALLS